MDDDEISNRFAAIEGRLAAIERRVANAGGEAIFAGVLIGPLIALLAKGEGITVQSVRTLIDAALLVLEKHRESLDEGGRAEIDHARARLEHQFRFLRAAEP
jgi:hypothetical protein